MQTGTELPELSPFSRIVSRRPSGERLSALVHEFLSEPEQPLSADLLNAVREWQEADTIESIFNLDNEHAVEQRLFFQELLHKLYHGLEARNTFVFDEVKRQEYLSFCMRRDRIMAPGISRSLIERELGLEKERQALLKNLFNIGDLSLTDGIKGYFSANTSERHHLIAQWEGNFGQIRNQICEFFLQELQLRQERAERCGFENYFNYCSAIDENIWSREESICFSDNFESAFSPIIRELRKMAAKRMNCDERDFASVFKLYEDAEFMLLPQTDEIPTILNQALSRVIGPEENWLKRLIDAGYFSNSTEFAISHRSEALCFSGTGTLLIPLPLSGQFGFAPLLFGSLGRALADLAALITTSAFEQCRQSRLIRDLSGEIMAGFCPNEATTLHGEATQLVRETVLTRKALLSPWLLAWDQLERALYHQTRVPNLDQIDEMAGELGMKMEGTDRFERAWPLMALLLPQAFSGGAYVASLVVTLSEQNYKSSSSKLITKLNKLLSTNCLLNDLERLKLSGFNSPLNAETIGKARFSLAYQLGV